LAADAMVVLRCNNKLCLRHLTTAPRSTVFERMLAPPPAKMYGEKHPNSRLDTSEVLTIRELAALGVPVGEISGIYDVSTITVRKIVQRRTWRHV
jgi:hypothetical protein